MLDLAMDEAFDRVYRCCPVNLHLRWFVPRSCRRWYLNVWFCHIYRSTDSFRELNNVRIYSEDRRWAPRFPETSQTNDDRQYQTTDHLSIIPISTLKTKKKLWLGSRAVLKYQMWDRRRKFSFRLLIVSNFTVYELLWKFCSAGKSILEIRVLHQADT